MKISKINLFAILFLVNMAIGCKEDNEHAFETIPFEATFFTLLSGFEENADGCASPTSFLNTQEGNGKTLFVYSSTKS